MLHTFSTSSRFFSVCRSSAFAARSRFSVTSSFRGGSALNMHTFAPGFAPFAQRLISCTSIFVNKLGIQRLHLHITGRRQRIPAKWIKALPHFGGYDLTSAEGEILGER